MEQIFTGETTDDCVNNPFHFHSEISKTTTEQEVNLTKIQEMTNKQRTIALYLAIGLVYALYSWLFGHYSDKGLLYNVGRGLIWPACMFPFIGEILGAIILVAVLIAVIVLG